MRFFHSADGIGIRIFHQVASLARRDFKILRRKMLLQSRNIKNLSENSRRVPVFGIAQRLCAHP